uniref:Putative secreted protein n=1 Tax=Anopheles marajoara TaxID=58244 RepID=A0A2M4C673_9DIPT
MIWFVWCIRYRALTKTAFASPSLKYSFSVVLNFLEYLTNSFFRCSTACLPEEPGMKPTTSFTASSSFLMALAISFIVSRNVFRSAISSGIRLRIRFSAADFLFSSWNASSVRFRRYSIKSVSVAAPCSRRMLSFMFTLMSPFLMMPITRSYVKPG